MDEKQTCVPCKYLQHDVAPIYSLGSSDPRALKSVYLCKITGAPKGPDGRGCLPAHRDRTSMALPCACGRRCYVPAE